MFIQLNLVLSDMVHPCLIWFSSRPCTVRVRGTDYGVWCGVSGAAVQLLANGSGHCDYETADTGVNVGWQWSLQTAVHWHWSMDCWDVSETIRWYRQRLSNH